MARMDLSTAEWLVQFGREGKKAFENVGDESPEKMLDLLAEPWVLKEIARLLSNKRMEIRSDVGESVLITPSNLFPPITLWASILWAGLHGYEPIPLVEFEKNIPHHLGNGVNRFVCAESQRIAKAQWDGYESFATYAVAIGDQHLLDHTRLNTGQDGLLVRRSPLQFVGRFIGDEEYEFKVTCDHTLTRSEVKGYLWLREMELRNVIFSDEDHPRTVFKPGEPVIAIRSKKTHCRTCYGRGSTQPVWASGRPPRVKCEVCHGTGRVTRKGA